MYLTIECSLLLEQVISLVCIAKGLSELTGYVVEQRRSKKTHMYSDTFEARGFLSVTKLFCDPQG